MINRLEPTIDEVIRTNLEQAYNQFNQAISSVAIDCAIYKICSCEKELELYVGMEMNVGKRWNDGIKR